MQSSYFLLSSLTDLGSFLTLDLFRRLRNGPSPPTITKEEITAAVSTNSVSHPHPLTRKEVTKAVTTTLDARAAASTPLTREEVYKAVTTALDSRPVAPPPLTMEEITTAVTNVLALAVELARLEERVKWLEIDRQRLQNELYEEKSKVVEERRKGELAVENKGRSMHRWETYTSGVQKSRRVETQSGRSVSG